MSGGGHGIDITGDSATVDNKGGMTVADADSIGIQIDGDKAVVNNDGDNAISNGGTGTQVNGDEATVNNNGNTTVDGRDSTGTGSQVITPPLLRKVNSRLAAAVAVSTSQATMPRSTLKAK